MKVLDAPDATERFDAEALIEEARRRQRRRHVIVVSCALIIAGAAAAAYYGLSGPGARSHTGRALETPASFLARARSGLEGTFSAVYQFVSTIPHPNNFATVTVAQRAPAGTTAWPGGRPGEWSYRLASPSGQAVEWMVRGSAVETCWRRRGSQWSCSAGNYPGDAGSIGYTIATIPYLPGTAYSFLSSVIDDDPAHGGLTIRTEPSRFGPLTCLVVKDPAETYCLTRGGHFASFFTSMGLAGSAWTKATLVSEQPTAPASDFTLSGVPKGPFELPLPG
jgi:hypothetical protein